MPHAYDQAFGPRSRRNFLRLALGVAAFVLFCAVPALAKKTPPAQPIDLNAANVKELEELPGIGPTTAKAIVDFRTKSGRFRRVNDLLVIRGISEAKLAKIRPYVTIGAPPKPPPSASAQKPPPSPAKKSPSP